MGSNVVSYPKQIQILFCVQQNKESHKGLEKTLGWVNDDRFRWSFNGLSIKSLHWLIHGWHLKTEECCTFCTISCWCGWILMATSFINIAQFCACSFTIIIRIIPLLKHVVIHLMSFILAWLCLKLIWICSRAIRHEIMVPWKFVYNLFPEVLSSQNSVICEDTDLLGCKTAA